MAGREEGPMAGVWLPRGGRAPPALPANSSAVSAARPTDGETDTGRTEPWEEETAAACTLLLPDSEPQALSTRWGFSGSPGEIRAAPEGSRV